LDEAQSDSGRFLWLETHGLHYASQASVQVNQSAWIPLNNETVTVSEPGKSYGGIGGGFATLGITVALPKGAVIAGVNTIRLPVQGGLHQSYTPAAGYGDISGGNVWEAAAKFRAAGVGTALVERLQLWGVAYTDRAARLQYH